MSRVRIYELAKEVGMGSKELTDKLMGLGYDVKGPSSTVDDDTAAKIRGTLAKKAETDLADKRSAAKAGPAVPQRRPTVILRKARTEEPAPLVEDVPEPAPVLSGSQQETAAALPSTEPSVMSEEAPKTGKEKSQRPEQTFARVIRTPPVIDRSASRPVERPHGSLVHTETPAVKEPVVTDHAKSIGEKVTLSDPSLGGEGAKDEAAAILAKDHVEGKTVVHAEPQMKIMPKRPEKRKFVPPPIKKGIARVVGTIDLPVHAEEAASSLRKKPGKPVMAKKVRTDKVDEVVAPTQDEGSRHKKKSRRGPETEEEKDRRLGKGIKKNQKNLKFTHFSDEYQRSGGKRGKKSKGRGDDRLLQATAEMKASKKRIKVFDTISVGELASRMRVKASEVIAKLMGLGVMATMNQAVDVDTAMVIATDFGYEVEQGITEERGIQLLDEAQEGGDLQPRSPVVTVMGHVDHGKTSILDAIRKTDVALGEAGGITQHIGAYHVRSSAGDVTFVDTPGHAAFTEMRSRGAQVTDLVILVVAADDGVMEQTKEAIHHAQAANVPIIVAVNKIDKPNADPERVKRELSDLQLVPEDWGGQTMYCATSAKQNIGIDELMEAIQLMAEMLELKADPKRKAKGRVIEAKLDKGRGAVATVLIQEGTLKNGDYFVVGQQSGKVRALFDDKGRKIKLAGPAIPVEVQGLSGVPSAGDEFVVVTDEKMAKTVSQSRAMKARESELGATNKISLDRLFEKMNEGVVQELRVIIRADVQGTTEAFVKAAEELSTKDIKVRVLHEGIGTISDSDILLASASEAIIIGFNVRPTVKVKELATRENVDIRSYDVIYHALDDIRKAMVGMLEPTYKENVIGTAEVRDTFSVPKIGTIAGCFVQDGKIQRNAGVRVLREGVVVYTGKIGSLRRFKDDMKEVVAGYECGIGVENYNDIKVGDNLEAFIMLEVEATLE
jgi:translation initiation factor IF-2